MQIQVDIGFENLIKIVKQLPKDQLLRFKKELEKESVEDTQQKDLRSFLLDAPVFTDEQVATIEQTRKEIDKWRETDTRVNQVPKTGGKFRTMTGKDGQHYFNLIATNGQVILSSEGYTTTAAMHNGIESVKKNALDDKHYERVDSKNGKFYFKLKDANGQVIGKSHMYESEISRDNDIESVKKNASDSIIAEE